MKAYLFVILAAMLLAVDFLIAKLYQNEEGTSPVKVFRFNFFIGLFSAVIFFFIGGCRVEFTWFSAILAIVMTCLAILYTLIGFKILEAGNTAYYSFFLMTGGMVVPYVWGLMFLDETFSLWRMAGLVLIVGAAFVIHAGGKNMSAKIIAMCAAIFLLNGFVSVISKEHQISDMAVSSSAYVILTSLVKVIVCGAILIAYKIKGTDCVKKQKSGIKPILLLVSSALISGLSYMLQLNGASKLPATVLYPIVTGGSIVFTALAGRLVLKEKLTKQMIFGLIICVAGTCLFL